MVDLVRSGRTPEELAREFEPTAQSISSWVKQDAGKRIDGPTSAEREEQSLRRENHRLRRSATSAARASASGYYAWRSRPASARATADADLRRHIRTIHAGSHGTYGAPRVHAELEGRWPRQARKRIARLVQAAGSRASAGAERRSDAAGDRPSSRQRCVRRNFMAERPNELWVADIGVPQQAA